jgi:HlyD family secretion protein
MAKKRNNRKVIIIFIILFVILGIFLFAIFSKKDLSIKVNVGEVTIKNISQTVSAIGKIEAETEVKISSQVSGEIIFLGVKEGDTVKANQLVCRIKPDIIDAQLKQMEASAEATKMEISIREAEMNKSKNELNRITELFKKDFASQREIDIAKAAYEQAVGAYKSTLARYEQSLAALQQTKREQERTSIYTPIGGIVTSLPVELGEKVVGTGMMAGTELMRVSDLSVMNAVVEVDENDISLVSIGDSAIIEIDAIPFKKYKGVVIEIGHSAITAQQGTQEQVVNFKVKVRLLDKEPKLRPGMSCSVDIITETKNNVLAVPLQAVTVRDSKINRQPDVNEDFDKKEVKNSNSEMPKSVVFVYKDGKAILKNVETGISDKGFIEIKSGLVENEKIIIGPFMAISKQLQDSTKVIIDTTNNKLSKIK